MRSSDILGPAFRDRRVGALVDSHVAQPKVAEAKLSPSDAKGGGRRVAAAKVVGAKVVRGSASPAGSHATAVAVAKEGRTSEAAPSSQPVTPAAALAALCAVHEAGAADELLHCATALSAALRTVGCAEVEVIMSRLLSACGGGRRAQAHPATRTKSGNSTVSAFQSSMITRQLSALQEHHDQCCACQW